MIQLFYLLYGVRKTMRVWCIASVRGLVRHIYPSANSATLHKQMVRKLFCTPWKAKKFHYYRLEVGFGIIKMPNCVITHSKGLYIHEILQKSFWTIVIIISTFQDALKCKIFRTVTTTVLHLYPTCENIRHFTSGGRQMVFKQIFTCTQGTNPIRLKILFTETPLFHQKLGFLVDS